MRNRDIGALTEEIKEGLLCQVKELGLYQVDQWFSNVSAYWNHVRKF